MRRANNHETDVRFVIVVDAVPYPNEKQLQSLRDQCLGRVRLRFNPSNLGAPSTRKKCLQVCKCVDDPVCTCSKGCSCTG